MSGNCYSALIGFDTKLAKLHNQCSHYITKALIVSAPDIIYESNSSFLQSTETQGVLDIEFETFGNESSLILELQIQFVEEYDTQLYIKDARYYEATTQIDFTTDRQVVSFCNEEEEIVSEIVVNVLDVQGAIRIPLVESNLKDFELPRSEYYFSNFFALEVQTDTMKFIKFFEGRQCDLSEVIIPYCNELLIKQIFVLKLYKTHHKFAMLNAKVVPNQALTKGVFFKVTEVDLKLDPSVLSLIDNIICAISNGDDVVKDAVGSSVKLSNLLVPGFLNRFLMRKNPKMTEINKPKYGQCPWLIDSENKKLAKMLSQELSYCESIADFQHEKYANFSVFGSMMAYLEVSYIPKELPRDRQFIELQKLHKSIALAACRPMRQFDGFGFLVVSNKQIQHQKLLQEFEIGSGNLAVCTLSESPFLQAFNRGNESSLIKLLTNNAKSLTKVSAKGLNLHCLLYELGNDFELSKLQISQADIERAIRAGTACIDRVLSAICTVRFYVEDMLYEQENAGPEGADAGAYPALPADDDCEQAEECRGSLGSCAHQSLANFNFSRKQKFEPAKIRSYFSGKTSIFFFQQPRIPLRTFQDSLDDEQERIRAEIERQKAAEAERLRLEREAKEAEEEAKIQQLLLEQQRGEEEKQRQREAEEKRRSSVAYQQQLEADNKALEYAQFMDTRKREMDETRRKAEAEAAKREEEQKMELVKKMQLKKLRNLKWQQQIQRFIVGQRGQIDTFYNDKLDQIEREAESQEKKLPQIKVLNEFTNIRQPQQPIFVLKATNKARTTERAKQELRKIQRMQAGQYARELVNLDTAKIQQIVVAPPARRNSTPAARLVGQLRKSPLNKHSTGRSK